MVDDTGLYLAEIRSSDCEKLINSNPPGYRSNILPLECIP